MVYHLVSQAIHAEPPHFEGEHSNRIRAQEGVVLSSGHGSIRSDSSQESQVRLPVMNTRSAKFSIGQVVKHRVFPFRGVVFDVDPVFANTDEWWNSIPEDIRPTKDQPFYHLLAENDDNTYVAYVSEQNLLADETGEPVGHPQTTVIFESFDHGAYKLRPRISH
jgi:heat shock protein HspQ